MPVAVKVTDAASMMRFGDILAKQERAFESFTGQAIPVLEAIKKNTSLQAEQAAIPPKTQAQNDGAGTSRAYQRQDRPQGP